MFSQYLYLNTKPIFAFNVKINLSNLLRAFSIIKMKDQTILCPHCSKNIQLTETLTHQMREQLQIEFDEQAAKQQKELEKQTKEMQLLQKSIDAQRVQLEDEIEQRLKKEKLVMWEKAQKHAKDSLGIELEDLKKRNTDVEKQLQVAHEQELEFRNKMRDLDEKSRKLELDVARRIDEERNKLADQIKKESYEESRLKMLEKDKQLELMRNQIEDLKRKSEQGSMQIQGEVQEEDLKSTLSSFFPTDTIEDVPTGINGADLVQTVISNTGRKAGVILWESKNTKKWDPKWLIKLKDDLGAVKGDVAIIVTRALPDGVEQFNFMNGIWVTDYKCFISLTQALRMHLQQINQIRSSSEGRDEKMQVLYNYLSGSQFKYRIENIINAFITMKEDLDKEKRLLNKQWNKREQEIERIVLNTTGMYGDLEGIMGTKDLPKVEYLELE